MLTRVFADNFRALVNFEFRPGRLSLLLGDNGSGKTTLFDVLGRVADLIVRGTSVSESFGGTRTRWDSRDVQRLELDVEGNGGTYRYQLEIFHPQPDSLHRPFIRSEVVSFDGETLFRFSDGQVHIYRDDSSHGPVFPFQSDQSFLPNLEPADPRLAWFKAFVAGIQVLQINPFAMQATSRQEEPFLRRDGANLASFFSYLNTERPDARTALENRLRETIPGFRNLFFKRYAEERLLLFGFTGENGTKFELHLFDLSEGQRALAVLYSALSGLIGTVSVLCLDEPDNFVALPEIQPWLQALRDTLDERGGQALVISHHPEVIDYLALDSAWRLERPSGAVVPRPLEVDTTDGIRPSELVVRGG